MRSQLEEKKMIKCKEKSLNIPGFKIALKVWNPECSKPVLCLHGKMDNAASFDLLAPLFANRQFVAVDYPGTGLSSPYPEGVLPNWKNDAFLMLHLIQALGWKSFDIVAHSLGGLLATIIALTKPQQVIQIIFLDILGPTANFIEKRMDYFHQDVKTYLFHDPKKRTLFPDKEAAIKDRMKIGNISYQAAEALVSRGTIKTKEGWKWTVDKRLHCLSATLPLEDELKQMCNAILSPVCLIRAKQGVPYPEELFQKRIKYFRELTIHEIQGGHHVHMDNPMLVAKVVSQYLD